MSLADLAKEFPREAIHWRAQVVTKDGTKAMALAYLDARDVMQRLDEVCGPDGWQTEHIDCGGGRLACRIGIKVGKDWVWKSDGAGNTDIEGEKGAFSSALKRAAAAWGIGRYLYDFPTPWVPCESYEHNGKRKFSKFTADPWRFVDGNNAPQGLKADRGPKGGRAKVEQDNNTLTLELGKDTYSYPMTHWSHVEKFARDLNDAVQQEAAVWDVNTNSIERARAKAEEHEKKEILAVLATAELHAGGGQNLQAG